MLFALWGVLALLWFLCTVPVFYVFKLVFRNNTKFQKCTGRVAIVTGSNTGIGFETAAALSKLGFTVIVACRDLKKGQAAVQRLPGYGAKMAMELDLSSVQSISSFSREFLRKFQQLHVLICNAGLNQAGKVEPLGMDQRWMVNFLGHFKLIRLLLPRMQDTAKELGQEMQRTNTQVPVRVVCLSSVMHHFGVCGDWECTAFAQGAQGAAFAKGGRSVYNDSKLAANLLVLELNKRFRRSGVRAIAVNPGAVRSDIWRHVNRNFMDLFYNPFMHLFYLNCNQGARPSLAAACLPDSSPDLPMDCEYIQPYWLPFGLPLPFEMMGPYVGYSAAQPSLPPNTAIAAAELWQSSETQLKRLLDHG